MTAIPPSGLKPEGIAVAGIATTRSTPGHREGIALVERCGPASIYRAALNGRIFHSGESNIDAIDCRATNDIPEVDNWHRLADITAFIRSLEAQLISLRHRQRCSDRHEIPEPGLPAAACIDNLMIARLALGDRDTPLLRSRHLEHLARGSARFTHGLIELPHAARAVGILIAEAGIAGYLLDFHSRPIGVEFIRDHHRQSCANALRPISERCAMIVTCPVLSIVR